MRNIIFRMVKGFMVQHFGTYIFFHGLFKESEYCGFIGILRYEFLLVICHLTANPFRKAQSVIPFSVYFHYFGPHLRDICPGSLFIIEDMDFCSFRIAGNRKKTPVSSPVTGKELFLVGCPAENTLPWPVCRMDLIGYLIGFFLTADEGFYLLNAFCIARSYHFRHLNDPVPLQFTVYVLVLKFPDIIGKPLVIYSEKTEEG